MGVDCLSLPPCASAHVLYPMQKVEKVECLRCKRTGTMVVVNAEVLQCSVCFANVDADPELRARAKRIEDETAAKRALLKQAQDENYRVNRYQRTRRV